MNNSVLIRHAVTEKSMQLASQGWYTFIVSLRSTKHEIAREAEQIFKVHVTNVKTITYKSEVKRRGKKRTISNTSPFKKAYIQLRKDEKIDLFETEKAQK